MPSSVGVGSEWKKWPNSSISGILKPLIISWACIFSIKLELSSAGRWTIIKSFGNIQKMITTDKRPPVLKFRQYSKGSEAANKTPSYMCVCVIHWTSTLHQKKFKFLIQQTSHSCRFFFMWNNQYKEELVIFQCHSDTKFMLIYMNPDFLFCLPPSTSWQSSSE